MASKAKTVLALAALMALAVAVQAEKLYDLEDDLDERKSDIASIYRLQFLEINKELVGETESSDPEKNFELLKEMGANHAEWFKLLSFRGDAVELFTSLPESLNRCGYKSYKVLAKNYVASQGRSHQTGGLRRVDAIVYHYAQEHAKKCRPQYADSFKKFVAAIDPKVYHHVTELFKELTEKDLVKFAKMEYMTDVDMITTGLAEININNPNTIRILEALERLIEEPADKKLLYAQADEINGGYMMSPKFQKNIYEEYIHKPCLRYLAKSRSVFAPARFDAAIEDDAQKDLLHPADEAFRKAWVNHRLCQYMIRMPPWERIETVLAGRFPLKSSV